jgi:3alpha(or 20beta)-hydroxysteroid dehydrogenase
MQEESRIQARQAVQRRQAAQAARSEAKPSGVSLEMRLSGRVAIITGAARGQGAAEARLFVAEGARVVIGDVLASEGEQLAKQLGPAARFVRMDVSQEADWESALAAARELGPLSTLVNNAAIQHYAALTQTTTEDYLRVIGVNQVGCFIGMRSCAPVLAANGGGSIVNVASMDGTRGTNGMVAYVSSKWAMRGLTKVAAIELGPARIRVNTILPGSILTPMGNPNNEEPATFHRHFAGYPLGRIGVPEEIARLALFLASEDSSYCTGAEFLADGGATAGVFYDGVVTSFPRTR